MNKPAFRSVSGFALVLVIALLALAVLTILALSTLTRTNTSIAQSSEYQVQARQNALMALGVAFGELQRTAGKDDVLTGIAGIAGAPAGAGSRARHWSGIWSSERQFITWLATGASGSGFPDLSSGLPLVSTASLGADATDREHVSVLRLPVYSRSSQGDEFESGGYAYWIGDEGVKLSTVLRDTQSPIPGLKHAIDQQFVGLSPVAANLQSVIAYEQIRLAGATTAQRQGGFHSHSRTHSSVLGSSLIEGLLNVNSTSVRYWTGVGATLSRNNPAVAGSMTAAQFGSDAAGLAGRPYRTVDDFLSALSPRLTARSVSPTAFASAMRPWLTTRSDTFRIRAYGDSVAQGAQRNPQSTAYCEAIVQRTPEMMPDGSGRRFVVTYFRWLGPGDI